MLCVFVWLPEVGAISYLFSHHSYHMIACVYSFNKYVGRTDEVVTSMKGIFPALKFFCCGVILQSGTETVTPEKFLIQN